MHPTETLIWSYAPAIRWTLLAAGATFLSYFGLLVYLDIARPENPGLLVGFDRGGAYAHAVVPASPADRAGVRPGDRIERAGGQPIRGALDWVAFESHLALNTPLPIQINRNGAAAIVQLTLARPPASYWFTSDGLILISMRAAQLISLVLAVIVAYKRPDDAVARLGAWVLATIGVFCFAWPYRLADVWRGLPPLAGALLWLPFMSTVMVGAILFSFFSMFPRRVGPSRWLPLVVWAPLAIASSGFVRWTWADVYRPERLPEVSGWITAHIAATGAYVLAGLGVLLKGYQRIESVGERRRVWVILIGSIVGLLAGLPVLILYYAGPGRHLGAPFFASPIFALGTIILLAFPSSLAYGILRHRVFDVGVIIRHGVQYALARRVLVSVPPALILAFILDLLIHRSQTVGEIVLARGVVYGTLAMIAVVARFRRATWLDALDRQFFRERYNAQRLLRDVADEVREARTLDRIAPRLVVQLDAALHPEFVAILARDDDASEFAVLAQSPAGGDVAPPAPDSKLMRVARLLGRPLTTDIRESSSLARQLPEKELAWIGRSRIELVVPVQGGSSGTEAALLVGPKRSEEPYSGEDRDLLSAIANSVGLLLDRRPYAPEVMEECPRCGACAEAGTKSCPADGTALATQNVPRVLAGRYTLERRLARGGMGTIYEATDRALGRRVAAKILRDELQSGADFSQRFEHEARRAASMGHPNVVTVHDFGVTAGNRAFLIMELLEGVSVRQALQQHESLEAGRVLRILRGVCSAVDAAHRRQFIHRDLKPENIFLVRHEDTEIPKVLDFGIAKTMGASAGDGTLTTRVGAFIGTPEYMAPEQLRGGDPHPTWDLWALAVITFEMLTGTLPFAGEQRPSIEKHFDTQPASLRAFFTRALSHDPAMRPASGEALCSDFEQAAGEVNAARA